MGPRVVGLETVLKRAQTRNMTKQFKAHSAARDGAVSTQVHISKQLTVATDVADLIVVETEYCSLNRSSLYVDFCSGERIRRDRKIAIGLNQSR